MNTVLIVHALLSAACLPPERNRFLTLPQIEELIRVIEVPTRSLGDGAKGPPEGAAPQRGFRFHPEIEQLGSAGPDAIAPLVALYENKKKPVQARAHAVVVLTKHLAGYFRRVDPRVLDAVHSALSDADPGVREAALVALCERGVNNNRGIPNAPPAHLTALSPASLRTLLPAVERAVGDKDPGVAAAATRTILFFGQGGVSELLAALERKEPAIRAGAVWALREVGRGDARVLPAIIAHLERPADPHVLAAAAGSVGRFGAEAKAAVPLLIKALDAADPENENLRLFVFRSLGDIGPASKPAVPKLLAHARRPIRSAELLQIAAALDRIDPDAARQVRTVQKEAEEAFRRDNK